MSLVENPTEQQPRDVFGAVQSRLDVAVVCTD